MMVPEVMQYLGDRLGTVTPKEPEAKDKDKDKQVALTPTQVVQSDQENHILLEKVLGKQRELQILDDKIELASARVVQAIQENHVLLEKVLGEQREHASVRVV